MQFKETEIQAYIWEHKSELFSMIQTPHFEDDPAKLPWEYEPWELLYYQALEDYKASFQSLERLEIFGCEVRLSKEGDSTIRTDFLGCIEGENGFVICELKVNKEPERQSYTELFAYSNHIRAKFAPMGRRDIFYLLIAPMEERIVREATISNLLSEKNRVIALIPTVGASIDSLRFKLWIPSRDEFIVFAKTAFAFENIDVIKICWKGAEGKWSPTETGKEPNTEMIHRLNKVSHYASQIMEANGINGFVFCSQAYPIVRDNGFLENGITICGINPFKSAKTRFVFELCHDFTKAAEASMEILEMGNIIPNLKNKCKDPIGEDYCFWLAEAWSSCLSRIGFDVVKMANYTFGSAYFEQDKGLFTWDSYLYRSSEEELCWNYDICLTGIFRELYDLKLKRYYTEAERLDPDKKANLLENGNIEWHCIDMFYSQEHIRCFLKGLRNDH